MFVAGRLSNGFALTQSLLRQLERNNIVPIFVSRLTTVVSYGPGRVKKEYHLGNRRLIKQFRSRKLLLEYQHLVIGTEPQRSFGNPTSRKAGLRRMRSPKQRSSINKMAISVNQSQICLMKPRRSHRKSRNGCTECKRRRIKVGSCQKPGTTMRLQR